MLINNISLYAGKIFVDLLRDIIYFPLWWYSRGLAQLVVKLKDFLLNKEKSLALLVWIKNIHKPMYGQYDWQGMLISFFMRLFQIIVRGLFLLFWLILALVILLIWLILPIFVVYEIIFQIAL